MPGTIRSGERVDQETGFLAALETLPDLILADYRLPQFDGLRALKQVNERKLDIPFIIISGTIGEDMAVEAMKQGAVDYLLKDRLGRMGQAVAQALEQKHLRDEKRQAEEALRESELRYRTITENMSDTVWLMDLNFRVTWISPSITRMRGYTLEELQSLTLDQQLTPESLQLMQSYGISELTPERLADKNCEITIVDEFAFYRKDGGIYFADILVRLLRDPDGKPTAFLGVGRDISERNQAEARLAQEQSLLQSLMDTIPDTIYFKDKESIFIRINQAQADHFGLADPTQALGKTDFDFFSEEHARKAYEDEQRIIRTGVPIVNIEEREIWPDRPDTWVLTTKMPLTDKEGFIVGTFGVSRDVTERKRAEEERNAHIRFLESLERVDQVIKQATDVEQMLWNLTEKVFSIFGCDRAWLFYPCDPEVPSFRVPVEITRPEYPGANSKDIEVPMSPDLAQNLREALEFDEPVTYLVGTEKPINQVTAEQYGVKSQMIIPLYPKSGKPWVFGMHQCSYPRVWTKNEKKLFKEISRRISDGLSSVLFLRELQVNEERFHSLFDNSTIGLYRTSPEGAILLANPTLIRMLGYSSFEELAQRDLEQEGYTDEYTRSQFRQLIDSEGDVKGLDSSWTRKDGSPIYVRESAKAIHGPDGKVLYYEGTVEDITERKQAETELRIAEEKYRLIFENSVEGIYQSTPQGGFITANPALAHMFGYDFPEELMAGASDLNTLFYVEPDRRQEFVRLLEEKETVANFESQIYRKDGSKVCVAENARAVRDENGKLLYYEGTVLDITERKLAELALRESEARWRGLVNTLPDFVALHDSQGRFLFLNHYAAGFSEPEVLGTSAYQYLIPESRELFRQKFESCLATGVTIRFEYAGLGDNGVTRWYEQSLTRLLENDQPIILALARDVTERKRSEQALRDAEIKYRTLVEQVPAVIYIEFGR